MYWNRFSRSADDGWQMSAKLDFRNSIRYPGTFSGGKFGLKGTTGRVSAAIVEPEEGMNVVVEGVVGTPSSADDDCAEEISTDSVDC